MPHMLVRAVGGTALTPPSTRGHGSRFRFSSSIMRRLDRMDMLMALAVSIGVLIALWVKVGAMASLAVPAGIVAWACFFAAGGKTQDRKSTRLNSSHTVISYAVFCLKKKKRHATYRPRKK